MATRPFYITAKIDGRKTKLTGGPRSCDGGMDIFIAQRSKGKIVQAFEVRTKNIDGHLKTIVYDSEGHAVAEFNTEY